MSVNQYKNGKLIKIAGNQKNDSLIGSTDISTIADGTVTGAINELNSEKGKSGGIATLDSDGKIDKVQIPDTIDAMSSSAKKLATARKIGNATFDGSKDISLEDMGYRHHQVHRLK